MAQQHENPNNGDKTTDALTQATVQIQETQENNTPADNTRSKTKRKSEIDDSDTTSNEAGDADNNNNDIDDINTSDNNSNYVPENGDLSGELEDDDMDTGFAVGGLAQVQESDDLEDLATEGRSLNNGNNNNKSNNGNKGEINPKDHYVSLKAQLQELKKIHPRFKMVKRYEEFLFNGTARDDIVAASEGKRWKIENFDNYCLLRATCIGAISETMDTYLKVSREQKLLGDYMEKEDQLKNIANNIRKAAEEGARDEERIKLSKLYDSKKIEVLVAAKKKPYGPAGATVIGSMRNMTCAQLQIQLRSGTLIWMDAINPQGGYLPQQDLIIKPKEQIRGKLSSEEAVGLLRDSLNNQKSMSKEETSRLLSYLEMVNNDQVTSQGHQKANEEKYQIENGMDNGMDNEDPYDEPPPNKRRKINNDSNGRFNAALNRSEDEA